MATPLESYEAKLNEARARLEGVQSQKKALAQEEDELLKVVQGWEFILAHERKRSGILPNVSESVAVSDAVAASDAAFIDIADSDEDGENKTQFVRHQIHERAATGTDIEDLKRAASKTGMKYPPSWPYGVLSRLKKRREIVKRRGKFYPATLAANGQLGFGVGS